MDIEVDKVNTGVSHSGCLVRGQLYIWGTFTRSKQFISKMPKIVPLKEYIVDFIMGDQLTVILTAHGDVYTIGENIKGQLGVENPKIGYLNKVKLKDKIEFVACGFNHIIVGGKNKIYGWGSNDQGQIQPNLDRKVIHTPIELEWLYKANCERIQCGSYQTFILTQKMIDFSLILTKDEKLLEELQKEVENLKVDYINQKTKNDRLRKKKKKLHSTLSVISNKDDLNSQIDPNEKRNLKSYENS